MGSFSWLKADNLTRVANVVEGKPFKFLIPKEFGGGFIKDHYQDYGYLGTKDNGWDVLYDMYELLAFWNADMIIEKEIQSYDYQRNCYITYPPGTKVLELLRYDGDFPLMKERDGYTNNNRLIGINIGCYNEQIDKLKYPLKLVSPSYKDTYEECEGKSYGDPYQGFEPLYRKEEF